jgi:hypothetical protein
MPNAQAPNTLYIFIDESGDFVFSKKGSDYFILTAISSLNPLKSRDVVLRARYELLRDGIDLEYFHATEDPQGVRDKFYSKIQSLTDYEIDSVIAEKRKANFTLYEEISFQTQEKGYKFRTTAVEEKFYKQICETLLQYVTHRFIKIRNHLNITKIIVVMDQCVTKRKREYITKSVKTYIKDKFGIVPYVYFHSTKSDVNSQVADYCCWAIKKKWADKEMRPYEEVRSKIKSEFDIFAKGSTTYY